GIPCGMIDVNVHLSRWPFRRLTADEPAVLVAELRKRGVTQAWAGTFDGVFHKDIGGANQRLAEDCRRYGPDLLIPFGSINPRLPDWREDLRRCREEYKMPGIRLHPNYHGYEIKDSVLAEVLRLAAGHQMIVEIATMLEDERTQHPLMRVPNVDLTTLSDQIQAGPAPRIVILNTDPLHLGGTLERLLSGKDVWFDVSMVEGVGGVGRLARKATVQRVVFGSHYP